MGPTPLSTDWSAGWARRKAVGIAVVAIAALGGLSACAPAATETVPTAESSQAPSSPANPEDLVVVDELPESVVEHGLFELLTPEQQEQMREWDAMSVDAFRSLPESEQLQFAEFVYRNNLPILKHRLTNTGQADIFDKANLETPEGVFNQNRVDFALITSLVEYRNGIYYDFETAKKLVVLLVDNTDGDGSNRIAGYDEAIDLMNVNTPAVVVNNSFVDGRINGDGSILVTAQSQEGVQSQQTYSIESFVGIDGVQLNTPQMILAVNADDPRFISLPLG